MEDLVIKLIVGILIATVSAFITVHLSLARFRSEKLWERKVEAYTKVIEAFHHSKKFSDKHTHSVRRGKALSKEVDDELRAIAKIAREDIDKYIDIGAFLFSDEFYDKLKKCQAELDKLADVQNWVEYLLNDQIILNKYLQDLILLAKSDLRKN